MNWWRRLACNRLLDVGVVVIGLCCVARVLVILPSRAFEWDFNHYYVSSRLLLSGQNPYTTPLGPVSREFGFVSNEVLTIAGYPPSFLWLFAPLAALPPRVAFAIWVMGEIACLGTVLWLTRQLLRPRLSARGWLFVCGAAVASQTVYWHFCYSQVQLLLFAMVLGAYTWHLRGRYNLACLTVTAAGLLKFYPFALLPWFVWRSANDLRTRAARMCWMLAFSAVVVLVTNLSLWRDFFRLGMPKAVGAEIGLNFHYSLSSLVTNLGLAAAGTNPPAWESGVWWAIGTVAGFLVIGLAYLACVRATPDYELEFSLLTVAMLAGTVTVQGHYFVWLIFPMAAAAARIAARPFPVRVVCFALVLLLVNDVTPPDPSFLSKHVCLWILLNYLPLYGLAALGFLLAKELANAESAVNTG